MLTVVLNLIIFIALVAALYYLQKKYVKFAKRVFIALGAGTLLGICLQWWYGATTSATTDTLE
ncbi:MAG: hypothetical protein ACRDCN_08125, partial [Tannerellaceae bacterium]